MHQRVGRTGVVIGAAVLLASMLTGQAGAQPDKPKYDPRFAFGEADSNHDGTVDQEEFYERMVQVFYQADADKDGLLSPAECSATLVQTETLAVVDSNHDGKLTLHEFMRARFRDYDQADTNADGLLELDEVVNAYEKVQKK